MSGSEKRCGVQLRCPDGNLFLIDLVTSAIYSVRKVENVCASACVSVTPHNLPSCEASLNFRFLVPLATGQFFASVKMTDGLQFFPSPF